MNEKVSLLRCPSCMGRLNACTDSRLSIDESIMHGEPRIRRARTCMDCKAKIHTIEFPESKLPRMVNNMQWSALRHPEVQMLIGRLFGEGKL